MDGSVESEDDEDITKSTVAADLLMEQLKRTAKLDSTYRKLHQLVLTEFPRHKTDLDDDLKPFWPFRDDLSTYGPLVLYKHRIVIPKECQKLILDRKCKLPA